MRNPASDSIRADHRRIEALLDGLAASLNGLSAARLARLQSTLRELRRQASAHFQKEEQILYPHLREIVPDLLARMEEQHEYARELYRLLEELLSSRQPLDRPRIAELQRYGFEFRHSVRRHIAEEEEYLLRIADAELSQKEQQMLSAELELPAAAAQKPGG